MDQGFTMSDRKACKACNDWPTVAPIHKLRLTAIKYSESKNSYCTARAYITYRYD